MEKIRCYECGKLYDWREDPFCPKCGAFNRQEGGGASGNMAVRRDGLNEADHKGSFLHRELHTEDSQRRRLGLEWTGRKVAPKAQRRAAPQVVMEAGRLWNKPKKQVNPAKVVGWIVLLIILWNVFGSLFYMFF